MVIEAHVAFLETQKPDLVECDGVESARALLRTITRTKVHKGQAVMGVWLIDPNTEQEDVFEIWGRVPVEISKRYYALKQAKRLR